MAIIERNKLGKFREKYGLKGGIGKGVTALVQVTN